MTLMLIIIFFIVMAIGVPVGISMAFSTIVSFFALNGNVSIIASRLFNGIDNFQFACIPFFILAAELMTNGGIVSRIVKFCKTLVGHIPGGLSHMNVLSSMFFAGLSGSANADAAGPGKVEYNLMEKAGFPKPFSAAVTAATAIIGPIIPPSTAMVIYCVAAQNVSITSMFLGGIAPGFIMGIALMILCLIIAIKDHHPKDAKFAGFKAIFQSLFKMLPAVFLPILILGGVMTGIFTPTESSIVAVFYSFIISVFVYKRMTWKRFYNCVISTAKTTASIYFIVSIAISMGWAITTLRIPQTLSAAIMSLTSSKVGFLLLANIILLVLGMVMDITPAILVMTPILLPIAMQYGIDPIQFGIIFVINMCIGLITPPVGMVLFITSNVTKVKLADLYKAIFPFCAVEFAVLLLITYIPEISTFIPRLFGY